MIYVVTMNYGPLFNKWHQNKQQVCSRFINCLANIIMTQCQPYIFDLFIITLYFASVLAQ